MFVALILTGVTGSGTASAATVVTASAAAGPVAHVEQSVSRVPAVPPNAPRNLRLVQITANLIRLRWDPPGGDPYPPRPGVVAYDIYATGSPFRLIATVPGTVLTYLNRRRFCDTVSYFVRARNAAGEVSAPSNVVTRHRSECKRHHDEDAVDDEFDARNKKDDVVDDRHHHDSGNDQEIIRADKVLALEDSSNGGGGGHESDHHEGHGGAGAEAHAAGGPKAGGEEHAAEQHAGKQLPFTGAPVAALAGVGGALLVSGAAGVLISMRRRRSTGAR
ncbi:hypothetical protein Skr01_25750 [Sphaerisporangium krabiense]|nr:hypothetical protein Skr01_25750 [Sphaerisporangium krabiense]